MPVYRFGDIHKRGKGVTVDIPLLAVNMPSKSEIEKEAIADQDAFLGARMLGLATKGSGRFAGLARATFADHAITEEPAAELYDRYEGGVWRMNKWLHLAELSRKVLQHTIDKVLARAFNTSVGAVKISRIKETISDPKRQARHIKRVVKKYGPA